MSRSKIDYTSMQALVALSNKQLAQYIWHFLKEKKAKNVQVVYSSADAIARARHIAFTHFFIGHSLEDIGGPEFTRFVRMSDGPNAEAPVLMIMSNPSPEMVMECRDVGVSEILGVPLTGKLLETRLNHTELKPKKFIRCNTYIGPDRRRPNSINYKGSERRKDMIRVAKLQKQIGE